MTLAMTLRIVGYAALYFVGFAGIWTALVRRRRPPTPPERRRAALEIVNRD